MITTQGLFARLTTRPSFSPLTRTLGLTACVACLSLTACDDEGDDHETGDDHDHQAAGADLGCTEVANPLASLDAVNPSGVTGAQLLALAEGTHTILVHATGANNGLVSVSPASHAATGTIVVTAGAAARHVVSSPEACTGDDCPQNPPACPDRVEVDVQVQLNTSDGAFVESWSTTLSALDPTDPDSAGANTEGLTATIAHQLSQTVRGGTFVVDSVNAPPLAEGVQYSVHFDAAFAAGQPLDAGLSVQTSWTVGAAESVENLTVYDFLPQ